MQFFTAAGMKEATGYGEPNDWYFIIVKELLDNAIDWLRDNYKGSAEGRVTASFTINEDYTKLNCKVKNSNPANKPVYAFTQLYNILNYDMTFGSKQNEYRATSGQLGDGLKRIMGLAFILMNMGDDTSAFFKKQWETPVFFRANSIERQALVKVNLGASEAINQITQRPKKLPHTDTEVEITLPIIDEVKQFVTLPKIERHCRLRTFATTDISFYIEIVDKQAQAKGYNGKAIIDLETKHPIPKNLHDSTSIHIYRPAEFVTRVESVYDRWNTTVYRVIRRFEEGAQVPKSIFNQLLEVKDVDKLSIADFMNRPDYQTKMLSLYQLLMEEENNKKLVAATATENNKKISLPFLLKDRHKNLAERLHLMYGTSYLETDPYKIAYTIQYGTTRGIPRYSFAFELVAVPMNEEVIRNDPIGVTSEFHGLVNGSYSVLGTKFDGSYSWTRKNKTAGRYAYADNIVGCLQECGFVFYSEMRNSRNKVPCAILGNLISERIDYTEKSKAKMDASPYVDTIIKAVEKVAAKVQTYKAIGITFASDSDKYKLSSRARATTTYIKDIVEMMLLPRIEKVKAGGKVTTEQTQDSLWYNALPLFEEYWVRYSNDSRAHFKNCIRELCKKHDIAREQIGIIAAPWASMFFNGEWYDISFDTVQDLARKGTDIIFIEKRDIVRALGKYASKWGVALVNTHGHLPDYAEDLAELADISGAHIAIFTDYDIPGILIASKLKENVPRLGVDERMLANFSIPHENTRERRLVIPYTAKVQRITEWNLQDLVENDKRFSSEDIIDIEFLKHNKIEIDAILADQGAEKLWEYLKDLLKKEFPKRNYLRVIDPAPDLSKHYPPLVMQLKLYCDKRAREITEQESKKIAEELKDVEGFIDVNEKEKEILDERLGKIVKEDQLLRDVAVAFEALDREKGYRINEIEMPPENRGSEN